MDAPCVPARFTHACSKKAASTASFRDMKRRSGLLPLKLGAKALPGPTAKPMKSLVKNAAQYAMQPVSSICPVRPSLKSVGRMLLPFWTIFRATSYLRKTAASDSVCSMHPMAASCAKCRSLVLLRTVFIWFRRSVPSIKTCTGCNKTSTISTSR